MISPPWKGFLVEDLHVLVYQFDNDIKIVIFLDDKVMEVKLSFEDGLGAQKAYEQIDEASVGAVVKGVLNVEA